MSVETIKEEFCETEQEQRTFDSMMVAFRHAVSEARRLETQKTWKDGAPESSKEVSSNDVFITFTENATTIIGSRAFQPSYEYLNRKEMYQRLGAHEMPLFFECLADLEQGRTKRHTNDVHFALT